MPCRAVVHKLRDCHRGVGNPCRRFRVVGPPPPAWPDNASVNTHEPSDCEPGGMPMVVRVATVVAGTTPAASTGQPRSPDFAYITSECYLVNGRLQYAYRLQLFFDEGLAVLREQYWGSRGFLEEVLEAAVLCGVPRLCWRRTNQELLPVKDLPEALQRHSGRRLIGSHSYELAFWPRDYRQGREPAAVFNEPYDEETPGDSALTPSIAAFLDAVLHAHPYVPGAGRDDTPWFDNPSWSAEPNLVLLDLQFGAVRSLLPWLAVTAEEHGLDAYDPQTESLLSPTQWPGHR